MDGCNEDGRRKTPVGGLGQMTGPGFQVLFHLAVKVVQGCIARQSFGEGCILAQRFEPRVESRLDEMSLDDAGDKSADLIKINSLDRHGQCIGNVPM